MFSPCKQFIKSGIFRGISRFTSMEPHVGLARSLCTSTNTSDQTLYDAAASDFVGRLHELIQKERILRGGDRKGKVLNFHTPQELQNLLSLDISADGKANEDLLSLCSEVIEYSVATGNVMFFNQLYSTVDPYGVAGAWLTECLNTNEHTFEVAPAFIIINNYIIKRLTELVGYPEGDGIFTPGGSMANIMSLALARYQRNPDVKSKGLFGCKRMVIFVSEMCHYSFNKAVSFLGMGSESCISVKTDDRGKMCLQDLKTQIQEQLAQGCEPLAVMATSGTTVLGAFDDLEGIADVCREYKLWMHVDYECTNIGFWYIPKRLRGQKEDDQWWQELSKVAPKIKAGMQKTGSMLIGYQPLACKNWVNFFRIIILSPRLTHSDLDHVIEVIDELGSDL